MGMKQTKEQILEAIGDAGQKFKRALKDRQGDSARSIRDQIDKIKNKDKDLWEKPHNPTGATHGSSGSTTSKGKFGESQTEARMAELGYERVDLPRDKYANNGIDGVFMDPKTGHVMIVESKYGTSSLQGDQMSVDWLESGIRDSRTSRLQHAMGDNVVSGSNLSEGLQVDGLPPGSELVTTAVSNIDAQGNVSFSFLN